MPLFENHAGINITSSKIQVVEVDYKDDCFYLENADEEYFSEFINFGSKETKIISVLQNSFNEILLRKPLNCSSVSFTFPHDFFRIVELPFEETLVREDLIENFKWELSVLYPETKMEEMLVEPVILSPELNLSPNHAIVIAAFKKYIKIIHKFCVRNNLNLKFVDNVHIAANPLSLAEVKGRLDGLNISIFLGEKDYSLMVLSETTPLHFSVNKFNNVSEIMEIIKSDLNKLESKNIKAGNIDKTYVFGDIVSDTFIDQIKKELGLNPVKMNPFAKIKISSDIQDNENIVEKSNTFVSAAGVALRLI